MPETTEYDWSGLTGAAVLRMRKPKIKAVPPEIIALAQASFDGVPYTVGGEVQADKNGDPVMTHIMERQFSSEEAAREFQRLVKLAGAHVKPDGASVSAFIDPDEDGHVKLVRWRAGGRRGR